MSKPFYIVFHQKHLKTLTKIAEI